MARVFRTSTLLTVIALMAACHGAPPPPARPVAPPRPPAVASTPAPAPAPPPEPPAPAPTPAALAAPPERDLQMIPQSGHTVTVVSAAVSPNGQLVMTGANDGIVKVWDVRTGAIVRTLGLADGIQVAQWLSDKRAIVSTGPHAVIWDVATGKKEVTFTPSGIGKHTLGPSSDDEEVRGIAVVPSGDVYTLSKRGVLRVWKQSGSLVSETRLPGNDPRGNGARLAEGGKVLYIYSGAAVHRHVVGQRGFTPVWQSVGTMSSPIPMAFAISPDGSRFAVGYSQGDIEVRATKGGALLRTLRGHKAPATDKSSIANIISELDFSPDGRLIASSGHDDTVRVWDAETGAQRFVLRDHKDDATSVAFSPDGKRLVSTSHDRTAMLWSVANGEPLMTFRGALGTLRSIAISPKGRYAAIGTLARLQIWDLTYGRMARNLALPSVGRQQVEAVAFSEDERLVAFAGDDPLIRVWSLDPIAPVATLKGHDSTVWGLKFRGGKLHSAANDGTVRTWDVAAKKEISSGTGGRWLRGLAMLPDGKIVTPSFNSLVLWGTEPRKMLKTWEGHTDHVMSVAASPDGRYVASGAWDNNVILWDVATGRPVHTWTGHTDTVASVAFTPDGKTVVSAASDGTIRRWDVEKRRPIDQRDAGTTMSAMALSPDGKYALVGGSGGFASLQPFDGEPISLLASEDEWLIFDRRGNFDASRDGGRLAAAVVGLQPFRVDQLALRNNRPDVLLAPFGWTPPDALAHWKTRHAQRLSRLGITEEALTSGFASAPEARIADLKTSGASVTLTADLRATAGELKSWEIYVNEVALFGGGGRPIGGRSAHLTETVPLASGTNRIEISATDAGGAESLRDFRTVEGPRKGTPRLFFVGIGVSRYRDRRLDLGFAAKDVQDIADVLRAAPKQAFGEVLVKTWVDEKANVESLKEAKAFLATAGVDDTVVLFVAGHGTHTRDAAADYYYLTHETDVNRIRETAASFGLVEEILQGIAPRRKLFLMDTCESGERDDATARAVTSAGRSRGLRSRALVLEDTPAAPVAKAGPSRPWLLDRERFLYNDLARRTGAIVLSSSRGSELSFERDDLANGVFTQAILDALTSSAADRDADGRLSPDELRRFVAEEVAKKTEGFQNPTVDRNNLEARILLPLAPGASGIAVRKTAPAR